LFLFILFICLFFGFVDYFLLPLFACFCGHNMYSLPIPPLFLFLFIFSSPQPLFTILIANINDFIYSFL